MSIHRFTHDFGRGVSSTVLLDTAAQIEQEPFYVSYQRSWTGQPNRKMHDEHARWMINVVLPASAAILGRAIHWAAQDSRSRAVIYRCSGEGGVKIIGFIPIP